MNASVLQLRAGWRACIRIPTTPGCNRRLEIRGASSEGYAEWLEANPLPGQAGQVVQPQEHASHGTYAARQEARTVDSTGSSHGKRLCKAVAPHELVGMLRELQQYDRYDGCNRNSCS